MSRFEYNFTRESEFQELKERNRQLQEENNSLKESLEELINVNNELTESIEELNNNNHYNQNHEDIEERFQMLIEENRNLREQLQNEGERNKLAKRSNIEEEENHTESLVAVLEELIDSFKNIQVKYEAQISDLQQALTLNQKQFTSSLGRMEDELNKRIATIDALTDQLKRKDEILNSISLKFRKIENEKPVFNKSQKVDQGELKRYEERLNIVNKTLEQKERVIKLYENLLGALKGKIMEKY